MSTVQTVAPSISRLEAPTFPGRWRALPILLVAAAILVVFEAVSRF